MLLWSPDVGCESYGDVLATRNAGKRGGVTLEHTRRQQEGRAAPSLHDCYTGSGKAGQGVCRGLLGWALRVMWATEQTASTQNHGSHLGRNKGSLTQAPNMHGHGLENTDSGDPDPMAWCGFLS